MIRMSKKGIILLLMICCCLFTALPVMADEQTAVQSSTSVAQVQPISPEQGAQRINNGFYKIYLAILSVIPNYAMIAILIGVVLSIIFAAFGASKMLKGTLVGLVVIVMMVVVAYAAPFITSMAQGVGQGL